MADQPAGPGSPKQPGPPMQQPPFPGAWRCDRPGHTWWHGTCHRKDGSQCHNMIPLGLTTCRMHPGGNAKVKHLAALAARELGRPARKDVDAATALIGEVAYQAGLCEWLDQVVARLNAEDMVWGVAEEREVTTAGDGEGGGGVERVRVSKAGLNTWVAWQERAHKQLAVVADMALRADVDSKRLELARAQGAAVFGLFMEGLRHLNLTAGQWELARQWMPQLARRLLAVEQ